MKYLLPAVFALLLCSCAPQVALFDVEVKDMRGVDIDIKDKQIAVYSLASNSSYDSIRVGNAAMALAEKLKQDRGLENSLPVFSIPQYDFAGFGDGQEYDKEYLRELMLETGADLQLFVYNLRYGMFQVEPVVNYSADYRENMVSLPYSVDMHVYDALEEKSVFQTHHKDTVYIKVLASANKNEFNGFVASKLPEVSRVVGEILGGKLTRQWERERRVLINFPDNPQWEEPLALAMDFKWKEAIAGWIPMTESRNARIAAYASYNIAVGCEMMAQFALAREWADFSVKKYRFTENVGLVSYLKKRVAND